MDPDDWFFLEEFVFPERGGIAGGYRRNCPSCGTSLWLSIGGKSPVVDYECGECGATFTVDWEQEFWG